MMKKNFCMALAAIALNVSANSDMYQMHFKVDALKKVQPSVPAWEAAGADGVSCKNIIARNPTATTGTYTLYIGGANYDAICLMPDGYTLVTNINASSRNHLQTDGYGSVAMWGAGSSGKLTDTVINELFTESLMLRCVGKSKIIPKDSSCNTWGADLGTIDGEGNLHCANSYSVANEIYHVGAAYYVSNSDRMVYGNPTQNGCFDGVGWGRGGELLVK